MSGLNIESLYNRYHVGIDFVLFLSVFVFICRASLSRVFPGDYGRKLGIVVGTILAISLSASERVLGFSLKSFGPLAAGLIILMVSLVVYNVMRFVGAGHLAGGSTALIITCFSMRAVLPGFFLWADQNEWAGYLHSILVFAILIAIGKGGYSLFGQKSLSNLKQAVKNIPSVLVKLIEPSFKEDLSELITVKDKMSKLTLKGKRECEKVIQILKQVAEIIAKHGADKKVAETSSKVLNDLKAREHILYSKLKKTEAIDKSLMAFDLSKQQKLKKQFKKLDKNQQAKCKKLFLEERKLFNIEGGIKELTFRAERHVMEL